MDNDKGFCDAKNERQQSKEQPQQPLEDLYDDDPDIDPVYHAKARILNRAIQEIGMGKYQIHLFVCAGFGWFADSVWPVRCIARTSYSIPLTLI